MDLSQYSDLVDRFMFSGSTRDQQIYSAGSLVSEASEASDHVLKAIRGNNFTEISELSDLEGFRKELGDVLFNLAFLAKAAGVDLAYLADQNITKLSNRSGLTFLPYLSPAQALVGRVENWYRAQLAHRFSTDSENPEPTRLLPVSCTVVEMDSLLGPRGVSGVLQFVGEALRGGAGCNVILDGPPWDRGEEGKDRGLIHIGLSPDHSDYDPVWANHEDPEIVSTESTVFSEWSEKADSRLIVVEDSLNDPGGILPSLAETWDLINQGFTVYADLSNLRPRGAVNAVGMESSGPVSFAQLWVSLDQLAEEFSPSKMCAFLSTLNGVIRRGGVYKNGAVTLSMGLWEEGYTNYISTPKNLRPYAHLSSIIPCDYPNYPSQLELARKAQSQGCFLEKLIRASDRQWVSYSKEEKYLRSNVCREILLANKGSCVLHQVNLGQITDLSRIPEEMVRGVHLVAQVRTGEGARHPQYASLDEDRQVGLGFLGLANLLRYVGVSYAELAESFRLLADQANDYSSLSDQRTIDFLAILASEKAMDSPAMRIVAALAQGYSEAARVAQGYGLDRAFAIAPTASTAYRNVDLAGKTTAPEISPPAGQVVERMGQKGLERFDHGPVETMATVSFEDYRSVASGFQLLMDSTGLAHAISFNQWGPMDGNHLQSWLDSPLVTVYYNLTADQGYLDKTDFTDASETSDATDSSDTSEGSGDPEVCRIGNPECEACSG